MRKNYLLSFTIFFLAFFANFTTYAQHEINAVNDGYYLTNENLNMPLNSIFDNDYLDNIPVPQTAGVVLSSISNLPPGISIDNSGHLIISHQTPNGNYSTQYSICDPNDPNNCDYATIGFTINFCRAATPTIDAVTQPSCSNPTGSVTLSGLPEVGTWTMSVMTPYGGTVFNGTGTTFTIDNLAPETYTIHVTAEDILMGGCFESFDVYATINPLTTINSTMTGTYVDYNNDGFTNVGDIISYQFELGVATACAPQQVTIASSPISIIGSPVAILPGETNNTIVGTYAITQNDINAGYVYETASVYSNGYNGFVQSNTPLNLSDGIKLKAFLDTNSNGIMDNGEDYFTNGEFQYDINNSGSVSHIASNNGLHFLYESNPANTYHLSFTVNGEYAAYYTVSPSSYFNITVPTGSGMTEFAFPITISPFVDLSVQLYNYGVPPRPGFTYQNFIQYTNHGNQTIPYGVVSFSKNPLLNITYISVPGTTTTANGFNLEFNSLAPNETRYIAVTMQVPTIPTVALGDLLTNSCNISIPTLDVNVSNNSDSYTQSIVGSYDPNDKSESHAGQVVASTFSADDYLTYTIRFENTGTANAINIKVDDLLDEKLDENTVRTLNASHPFVLKRINNALTWRFDGINLPPSVQNDDVTGHGYIVFQVKPKSGFAIGDIIPNTADIFFDFNPAIVTNTCTTEFVPFLGTSAFENNSFEYYPNPTSGILTFNFKNTASEMDRIEVLDVLGKPLISKTANSNTSTLDLSALSKGIYLVKISANGVEKTFKIIKK